ncbi:MAG: carbonic anhydrase, partial [Donghicola eburneus]
LRPGYAAIEHVEGEQERLRALEKKAVCVSLENLMTFPFIEEAVNNGTLSLHGLWTDIGEGSLEYYEAKDDKFLPV